MLTGKYRRDQPAPAGSRVTIGDIGPWMRRDYFTDRNFAKVERLRKIAQEYGMSPANLSLAWVLATEGVSSAIIGASQPEQVRSNVQAVDLMLTDEMKAKINQSIADNEPEAE